MRMTELTSTVEDYLKVVWSFEELGAEKITTKALAKRLGVTAATVSITVRRLTEQGLLEHPRFGGISLTEAGRRHAVRMVRRHRLIETFLVESLGYGWDEVHDEAEILEHAVSDRFLDRIDELLGHPERDPHGDPIPSRAGELEHESSLPLVEVKAPGRARVVRISDDDAELLRYFAERGLVPGATIELADPDPFADGVIVKVADARESFTLGPAAAHSVRVLPA